MRWFITFEEDDLLDNVNSFSMSACGDNIHHDFADAMLHFMQVAACDSEVALSFLEWLKDPENCF